MGSGGGDSDGASFEILDAVDPRGRGDGDQSRVAQHGDERAQIAALCSHLNGVVVETADHVGGAAEQRFEGFRAAGKIDQRDGYASVAIVAQFLGQCGGEIN